MNQFNSAPGQNKKGFAEHLEKDKKIGEEVEIEELLKEIEELMPKYARLPITIGVSEDDNAKDRKALKKAEVETARKDLEGKYAKA